MSFGKRFCAGNKRRFFRARLGLALCAAAAFVAAAGCGRQEPECPVEIAEETVFIEGLEGEYRLLFVTDAHAVVKSRTDVPESGRKDESLAEDERALAECEQERYPMFFNAHGADSRSQFEAFVRYANEQKVDGVLLGGDIIDTPSEANLTWLAEQLALLEMPYLFVPGNHDWTFPWEYMTDDGREELLPLLEPFTRDNTAVIVLDFGEFAVVGVDDSDNQVAPEALPEFERLCAGDKPLIALAHVPFLTQSVLGRAREVWSGGVVIGGGNYGGIYPDEYSDRFVKALTAADSSAELMLAGHVHFFDKDVIEGEKDVLQLVGGAGFEGKAVLLRVTGRR